MPRFMGFVRMQEGVGTPPQALFDAMDEHIGARAASGVFLDGGGLFGTEDAVNYISSNGEVTRVDGPYAEAKEVVGGWALMEYPSVEAAVADQQEFAELHAKHWPEVTVIATLRQISEGPEEPAPENGHMTHGADDTVTFRPEERFLRDRFGTPYDDYCRRVRRWL